MGPRETGSRSTAAGISQSLHNSPAVAQYKTCLELWEKQTTNFLLLRKANMAHNLKIN